MHFHRLCVVSYAIQIYTLVLELVLEIAHSHVAKVLFFKFSAVLKQWDTFLTLIERQTYPYHKSQCF